jgi:hypothetical protein
MPFEIVSNGKRPPRAMFQFVKFDGRLEERLFEARQADFMRQHPQGARCSGDPFRPGTGHLVDPAHVMSTFRLKKPLSRPFAAMGDIHVYALVCNAVRQAMSRGECDNLQFFPARLVHGEGELSYWIYRHIRLFDCVDPLRSGYASTTYADGKSAWVRPREKPTVHLRKACVGDRQFWLDVYVQGPLLFDEFGASIAPFLPQDCALQRAEWV